MVKVNVNTKDEIYLTSEGLLMINGKEYIIDHSKNKDIDGIEHLDKEIFKEFNRKDFEKKVSFIVDKIKDSIEKKELIKEIIQKKAYNQINNLYKVFSGKEKKKISKQKGCLGLKIGTGKRRTGGAYLELVD